MNNKKEWSKPTIIDLYSSESQTGTLGALPGQEGNHVPTAGIFFSAVISS